MDRQFINYELRIQRARRSILYGVLIISLFGALLVYDASSVYAWFSFSDAMYFLKRQILFIILGFILMTAMLKINLEYLRKYSKPLLIFGIGSLVLVLIFGSKVSGARRWFRLLGFGFQPSEFMKILFLLYLTDYFARKEKFMKNFAEGVLPVLIVTGLVSFLIFLEPDFGNAIFFGLLLFIFLFVSKVPKKYLLFFLSVFLALFILLVVSSPYRLARVLAYLNPWADSQGGGFQLVQSHIGLGSGGILGLGLGESRQKLFFLPAAHTDFIFSIIAEEFGFIGSFLVLFSYLFIFFQGLRVLRWTKDIFRFYLGWAVIMVITFQALINISVVVGIFPTKGLPLPFISYGGSSTIVSFMLLGLFLNATKET
ncbi:MAG: putative lipid II flippase FtsW [Candidatus Omnitrophica bacterium]|nr:putative lipid II flippase FtsW [Candidatus Omnitrophota bacterium]